RVPTAVRTFAASCLTHPQARRARARQLFHSLQFGLQAPAAVGSESVRLLVAGGVFLLKAFDPGILEEAVNRPVERSGAQPDAAAAQPLDILQQGVSVA